MTTTELPTIDYSGVRRPEEAHAIIAATRRRSPVAMGPLGPELLTYELVHVALRDSRFAMPPANGLAMRGITSGPLFDRMSALIVGLDGAAHRRLSRLVAPAFTPRAAERMRHACRSVVTELIDAHLPAGHCDVVSDIARPYPVPIICALLGVPRDAWEQFSGCLRGITKAFRPDASDHTETILAAWQHLDNYLDELIERRRRSPSDDLLSELLRAGQEASDGDRLTYHEIRDLVAVLLLAGTDTTRNQLAAAVEVFAQHPEQWELLAQRPELAPQAVREVMRHSPASFCAIRIAVDDVEQHGVRFPAGTSLVVNTAAANRDPARYRESDRFDISRESAAPMMTFGGGAHHCLGAHLARVELTEALVAMSRCMPEIRTDGPPPWRPIVGITGPTTLPTSWRAAGSPPPVQQRPVTPPTGRPAAVAPTTAAPAARVPAARVPPVANTATETWAAAPAMAAPAVTGPVRQHRAATVRTEFG